MIKGPILIVDDDPWLLEPIATALELAGYTTQTASGGTEGLKLVLRERPAVILLDLHMPDLDGRGLVHQLVRRGYSVPTVLMSANEDVADAASELGVNGYLKKPFEVRELLHVIATCVGDDAQEGHRSAA